MSSDSLLVLKIINLKRFNTATKLNLLEQKEKKADAKRLKRASSFACGVNITIEGGPPFSWRIGLRVHARHHRHFFVSSTGDGCN